MGVENSLPTTPHSVYTPPAPAIVPTGPNSQYTWADISIFLKGDSQRLLKDKISKQINRTIHWAGKIVSFNDSQNIACIQMNPSIYADKPYDIIVKLPISTSPFSDQIGKTVDFTGKIEQINSGIPTISYLNYGIGPVQLASITPQKDITQLNQDLQTPLSWCEYLKNAHPDTFNNIFNSFMSLDIILTAQIVQFSTIQIEARLFPKISQNKDLVANFPDSVKIPATVKQGSICSIYGKLLHYDVDTGIITMSATSIVHHNNPNASLEKLPQTGGKVSWDTSKHITQNLKSLGDSTNKAMADIRGAELASPSRSEASTPMKEHVDAEKVIIDKTNAISEPQEDDKPETLECGENNEVIQEQETEIVEQKTTSIYDEKTGKVKLDEPESEFKSMDPMEVAALLMKDAPKTSYTETAISANLLNDDDDDALKRIKALKQSGLYSHFTEQADKHLADLGQMKGSGGGSGDYAAGDYYDDQPANNYYDDQATNNYYNAGGQDYNTDNYYSGNDYDANNYNNDNNGYDTNQDYNNTDYNNNGNGW
ncbi:hypothetical protein SS50377_26836 [Spironucleus salmonicida]|uniref:Uncharacterized protein n=1 Tax=Spironucleus salmonicida TaxID=348837 RepID=V6M798_9EUKA|nr:hypothetical protein SS50377_26836 [Spironucleus salmonicida]|eukprot:EST49304.1 hypothetical protein SS50377_10528 [Spironucleus salmonicida]